MTDLLDLLRSWLAQYGYGAVAAVLLLENAGLPLPGETVLLLASFMAFSEHRLQLRYVILVGIAASTLGDGLGYALGSFGGRRLLHRYQKTLHISPQTLARGEGLFAQYGAFAVFFARFIAGMRIVAGPLAGVLRMPWRRFFLWNLLGAVLWVSVISHLGYLFGRHWNFLVETLKDANLLAMAVVLIGAWLWWLRARRSRGIR